MADRPNSRINATHVHYGSLPGRRDNGERFKVTYLDGKGTQCVYGFATDRDVAEYYVDKIKQNGVWSRPRIIDREVKRA